ncbi:MAG TPA: hypothetical protein VGX48_12125 [Pyrinomonadaceae bacterium]|jgi:hypothetical protein|nr:hypothetical protein [Pyrinomonadaceae bacterium]
MGAFARWLLDEEQKELYDQLFADALTLVFLGLAALALWPLGRAGLAWQLTKGYGVFWVVLASSILLLALYRRVFRVDVDDNFDAYALPAVVASGFIQAGWSAFAALTVRGAADGAGLWTAVALYAVGFVSAYVAFGIVSSYYGGSLYRTLNLPLSAASFVLFCLWPAAGRVLYGWFFGLF